MKNEFIFRYKRNKLAVAATVVFLLIVLMAVLSGFVLDYDNDVIAQNVSNRLKSPSAEHWLGTDEFGRDILSRLVYGSRYSLLISFSTVLFSTFIGLILGSIAGYSGGFIDNVIMRIMDVFLSIPSIIMAIAIVASIGAGVRNLIIAFIISGVPGMARLVRVLVLSVKGQEYIEAAKAVATPKIRIVTEHIWPNIMGPIIIQSTLSIAHITLMTATLSFMGLGVRPPNPEWGSMLSAAKRFMLSRPNLIFFPGIAIIITVLVVNLIGDGIRDAIDPRLRD